MRRKEGYPLKKGEGVPAEERGGYQLREDRKRGERREKGGRGMKRGDEEVEVEWEGGS